MRAQNSISILSGLFLFPLAQAAVHRLKLNKPSLDEDLKWNEHEKRSWETGQVPINADFTAGLAAGSHRLPIPNFAASQYFTEVTLGTPPQTFKMLLDTNSSSVWVPSTNCTSPSCARHAIYDSTESSTYGRNDSTAIFEFGMNSVEGFISTDTLTIGDIALPDFFFAELTSDPDYALSLTKLDGVLGLAFPPLAVNNISTVLSRLDEAGVLDEPVFSLRLGASDSDVGELILGGIDEDAYEGMLNYFPVTHEAYWQVGLDEVSAGGETLTLKNANVAFNTGSSLIIVPAHMEESINRMIHAVRWGLRYVVPCQIVPTLPTFYFKIGGVSFPLAPEAYIVPMEKLCLSAFVGINITAPSRKEEPVWFLGDTFLRRYYSVFDFGTGRVGLAPLA